MSFLPNSRAELIEHLKRGMFVLAVFAYLMFLSIGMDTGLGVYYLTLGYCWAALACAIVAMLFAPRKWKWLWGIAGLAALIGNLYGHHHNSVMREELERIQRNGNMPPRVVIKFPLLAFERFPLTRHV